VLRSQPWLAEASGARRLARAVVISQLVGGIVGFLLVFWMLGVANHDPGLAGVLAGAVFVFNAFVAWLVYHVRKSQAIIN